MNFSLNDEPDVSKLINFMLFNCVTNLIRIAPVQHTLCQKQHAQYESENFSILKYNKISSNEIIHGIWNLCKHNYFWICFIKNTNHLKWKDLIHRQQQKTYIFWKTILNSLYVHHNIVRMDCLKNVFKLQYEQMNKKLVVWFIMFLLFCMFDTRI